MFCPVCKSVQLQTILLEHDLPAAHCPQCSGHWIDAQAYHQWLASHPTPLPEIQPPANAAQALDTPKAKTCPHCASIMLKYRVGRDMAFQIDQCGSCGGFWFDYNEWEALKARNLHDEIHYIVTTAWQRTVRQQASHLRWQQHYQQLFGAQDYAEIQRVHNWLSAHPQRTALLAYLSDHNPYTT